MTENKINVTEATMKPQGSAGSPVRSGWTGSILPPAQEVKVRRLIEDGCGLGSVLLHKTENGRGMTAIVSPHGHVEWAK